MSFKMADTDVVKTAVTAAKNSLNPGWHDYVANARDFRVDTFVVPKSGFGLTDVGVRVTHIPSGKFVESCKERSQLRNRDAAFSELIEILKEDNKVQTVPITTPKIPSKSVVLDMYETATTKWLDKAIDTISELLKSPKWIFENAQTGPTRWQLNLSGYPSNGDIKALGKELNDAGWLTFEIRQSNEGNTQVIPYKD